MAPTTMKNLSTEHSRAFNNLMAWQPSKRKRKSKWKRQWFPQLIHLRTSFLPSAVFLVGMGVTENTPWQLLMQKREPMKLLKQGYNTEDSCLNQTALGAQVGMGSGEKRFKTERARRRLDPQPSWETSVS